jgi:hypothetical protein
LLGENDHWFAADVSEKLIALSNEKQYLMTLWEERRMLFEHCIYLLIKETEEAEKNPPYSADDQELYFSDEEEWDRSRSLALFPHVDRIPEETRKQYALSKLEMARCALIPGLLKGLYENAKLELKFAEHAFPMEETKKMLEQLAILEQTSRTETN